MAGLDIDFGDIAESVAPLFGGANSPDFSSLPSVSSSPSTFGNIGNAISSGISSFGDFAKSALPIAQLGLGGLSAAQGVMGARQSADQAKTADRLVKSQEGIADAAKATAAPVAAFSADSLGKASAGQIPAASQAQIDLWAQAAKQQARDFLARSGNADSTTAAQWEAWIDKQAVAMAEQALQGESAQGIQAGGTAGGILNSATGATAAAASATGQQETSIENLIASANQTLAKLTAGAS